MTKPVSRRVSLGLTATVLALGAIGCAGLAAPASAQVVYAHPAPLDQLFAPTDETAGTSPSFEIFPRAYDGAPAVRIVERCQYPNGWNATDFSRDVNGTPAGIDHTCPDTGLGRHVRARY